ncbi:MAG: Lnb N-terminal periplasmic domain-containing protein [Planctomycetota bacterium]|jgi:hypothetical protein
MCPEGSVEPETGADASSSPRRRSWLRRSARAAAVALLGLALLGIGAWCVAAIHYSNLPGGTLRSVAAGCFGLGWIAAFVLLPNRVRTTLWFLASFIAVLTWWRLIPASNDRDWQPEFARTPFVDIQGSTMTVRNVRNCDYRSVTDFDVHYYDKTFELEDLQTVDFIYSSWGLKDIMHTMLSFGLRDGDHLVLSVVPRREKDEPRASELGSIFKQYELIYILADECDVLRLRTRFRKEDLYVLPTTASPEMVQELFVSVADRINDLSRRPRYYNLLTHNCTTSLATLIRTVHPPTQRWNWRYLINAFTAKSSYEAGVIASPLSFEDTVERCHVNRYVEDYDGCDGYSELIRPDLASQATP